MWAVPGKRPFFWYWGSVLCSAVGRGARGEATAKEGGRWELLLYGGLYQTRRAQDDVIALLSPTERPLSASVRPRGSLLSVNVRPRPALLSRRAG